jgi:hypothetical protein
MVVSSFLMKRATLFLLAALSFAPLARAKEVLPFIDDDYSKAVARAKAKNVPLFVDAWAPW